SLRLRDLPTFETLPGVTLTNLSFSVAPGQGRLRYLVSPNRIQWREAGDDFGSEVLLPADGTYVLASANGTQIQIEVSVADLPTEPTERVINVPAIRSGLYEIPGPPPFSQSARCVGKPGPYD